jgi:hypothetical protein
MLLPYGHGYPLWVPESDENLPETYRIAGVSVGDLGHVSERGGFEFLFNVLELAEDDVNTGRTPEDYSPLLPFDKTREITCRGQMHKQNTDISSVEMTKTRVTREESDALSA